MSNILKRVFALYDGRIDQRQFIVLAVIMFVIGVLVMNVGIYITITTWSPVSFVVHTVLQFLITLLTMHLYVRRLHDIGVTGLLVFVILVLAWIHVLLGLMCFLALAAMSGMPFANHFGPVPQKDRPLLDTFLNT